jgi:hypothetical protein
MKGNGIRDLAKPKFIFESISEYHLDFIALLETKRNGFHLAELAHFCTNIFFVGLDSTEGEVRGYSARGQQRKVLCARY